MTKRYISTTQIAPSGPVRRIDHTFALLDGQVGAPAIHHSVQALETGVAELDGAEVLAELIAGRAPLEGGQNQLRENFIHVIGF